ncbi:hypothetical protein AHF37_11153 [Paragonimus kellicotti]|nr:hypothetical protein AHF37_11153 [Paragonimus kellicotti]
MSFFKQFTLLRISFHRLSTEKLRLSEGRKLSGTTFSVSRETGVTNDRFNGRISRRLVATYDLGIQLIPIQDLGRSDSTIH